MDLQSVFREVGDRGYSFAEIYTQRASLTLIAMAGRMERSSRETSHAASLRLTRDDAHFFFSFSTISTELLLAAIRGEAYPEPSPERDLGMTRVEGPTFSEKVSVVSQIARQVWPDADPLWGPTVEYRDKVTHFSVATSPDDIRHGSEEESEISLRWHQPERPEPFVHQQFRRDIRAHLTELKRTAVLKKIVDQAAAPPAEWPVPSGNLPVIWSARAVSKLAIHFLRAFEGDRVLGKASFLSSLENPLALRFGIEERERSGSDHEGSPTGNLQLLDNGSPRELACDRKAASRLKRRPTGHSRRATARALPTIGWWRPRLVANSTIASPISQMSRGLSIRDLQVLRLDPLTGEVRLRILDAALVHHGAEGERVEPFHWDGNLVAIFESFELFSEALETHGFPIHKKDQRFITELEVPAAVSPTFPIEGRVPQTHYW